MKPFSLVAIMCEERAKKGSLKGKICQVEGCIEPMMAKNMCAQHYKQHRRTGEVKQHSKGRHGPPEVRFWNFVNQRGKEECWIWAGNKDKDGYGSLRTKTSQVRAHRLSYQIHKGEIPQGLMVRHLCNNPSCVNPNHLEVGTQFDNMRDRLISGRSPTNEKHPNCKFSNEIVEQVRAAIGTRKSIAIRFGISESQVGNIRSFAQRPIEDD